MPVIRLAEILLVYAEAKAELGELTQSDLDLRINKLRDRVGMTHLTLNPRPDAALAAKYPQVTSSQKNEILEIRRERRIELALEGPRFDDLMRWHAGKLLEKEPDDIYFSGLEKHDLTGDGVPDIMLLEASQSIPTDKEVNELGKTLMYYRLGTIGQDASVFVKNGNSGNVQTTAESGVFVEPKYYYRPIPQIRYY